MVRHPTLLLPLTALNSRDLCKTFAKHSKSIKIQAQKCHPSTLHRSCLSGRVGAFKCYDLMLWTTISKMYHYLPSYHIQGRCLMGSRSSKDLINALKFYKRSSRNHWTGESSDHEPHMNEIKLFLRFSGRLKGVLHLDWAPNTLGAKQSFQTHREKLEMPLRWVRDPTAPSKWIWPGLALRKMDIRHALSEPNLQKHYSQLFNHVK